MKDEKKFYFTTRDLMMMAALAALGGVSGTYINFIGDFFQSLLGFAGTTQWAAGLHAIWIMLAAALVGKPGAATATGILKGFVEFLSGNTHGLLVLIVDIVAGLIVDLVLLPRRDKTPGLLFYLAAGLSSASNVIVFQFFASVPEDLLTFFAILFTSSLAFISGVVFGGLLARSLFTSLSKIGILPDRNNEKERNRFFWPAVILITALLLAAGAGIIYFRQQTRLDQITVHGNVANPYTYPNEQLSFNPISIKVEQNGAMRSYSGVRLAELVDFTRPINNESLLQVTASDGYSFFISLEEVYTNPNLILSSQKVGNQAIYSVVGAESTKAWVRGVIRMEVISSGEIAVSGNVSNQYIFSPQDWVVEMDSTFLNLNGESVKLQGVSLRDIWERAQASESAKFMRFYSGKETLELNSSDFLGSDATRIFTLLGENGMEFVLGQMNGNVISRNIHSIEIK